MKKITYAFLILLLTAACAKDSDDARSDQQIAAVPPPEVVQNQQYPANAGPQRPPYGYQPVGSHCNTNYQQFTTREQYCSALGYEIRARTCVTQQHVSAFRQFCGRNRSRR